MDQKELEQHLKKNKALLKHSSRLPDGGQKIKNAIEELEAILGQMTIKDEEALPTAPPSSTGLADTAAEAKLSITTSKEPHRKVSPLPSSNCPVETEVKLSPPFIPSKEPNKKVPPCPVVNASEGKAKLFTSSKESHKKVSPLPSSNCPVAAEMKVKLLADPPPLTTSAYKELYKKVPKDQNSNFRAPSATYTCHRVYLAARETLNRMEQELPDLSIGGRSPPRGLRTKLLPHQAQALRWLLWRERQVPAGGILADDMGLGKTLTAISLILKSKERHSDKLAKKCLTEGVRRPTLVVCPASLIHHWVEQVTAHCLPDQLSTYLYHGSKRDSDRLSLHDVVITTYNLVMKEVATEEVKRGLGSVKWYRVMLDEGHVIKNHSSKMAQAICHLSACKRWVLTGTPIHNGLWDLFSLLKFLHYEPFCDRDNWKAWVVKNPSEQNILTSLVRVLVLRRTKSDTDSSGKLLVVLPKKTIKTIRLRLSSFEEEVYSVIKNLCKDTLKNYLHQQAQKSRNLPASLKKDARLLLVLLLRLQQCCCHLHLLQKAALAAKEEEEVSLPEDDLVAQLSALTLEGPSLGLEKFSASPELEEKATSSKLDALLKELQKIRAQSPPENCVVVSQWTSYLDLICHHLQGISFDVLCIQGNMTPEARAEAVNKFNASSDNMKVMLVSLKAGGVGLNLIGGCHLFLMDLHWNPALEAQAADRIHRVGQTRDVTVHKFVVLGTVEEQVLRLQKQKLSLASSVLQSTQQKLGMKDIQALLQ